MEIIIGKVLNNGEVKYINVSKGYEFDITAPLLQNFFSKEERLDAMLALGNLERLGATPHGMYYNNYMIHCCAEMRDNGSRNKVKHSAKTVGGMEEFYKVCKTGYFWMDSKWYVIANNSVTALNQADSSVMQKPIDISKFKLYKYADDDRLEQIYGHDFPSWAHLEAVARESDKIFYVFKGDKLIAIINPQKNKNND